MTRILFWYKGELTQPIPRQLSKKVKMFDKFCTSFVKSTFNFEHCEKTDEPHILCIIEVIDGEKSCYVNV